MLYPAWKIMYGVTNTELSVPFSALAIALQFGGFLSNYTDKVSPYSPDYIPLI